MAKFKIGNLLSQLGRQITKGIKERIIRPATVKAVNAKFQEYKQAMLADFNSLPIIDALEYGPGYGSNDFAGVLSGAEWGDLFSFLGFPRKFKPANKIRNILKRVTLNRADSSGLTIAWEFKNFPTIQVIEEETKNDLPWVSGKSWVTWLEKGVPGLGRYINVDNDTERSRSHFGLQVKNNVRAAKTVKAGPWMTDFLDKWRREFEKIDERVRF